MELFAVRSPIAMSSGARPSRPVGPSASAANGGPSKRKWKNKSDDDEGKHGPRDARERGTPPSLSQSVGMGYLF